MVSAVPVSRCVGCENIYIYRDVSIYTCIYVYIASRGVECENTHTKFCCIYRIHICLCECINIYMHTCIYSEQRSRV